MQRLVHRLGLPAIITGYAAILCGLAASLILAFGYHDQLTGLKRTLQTRCASRLLYDERTDEFKQAVEAYYVDLLRNLAANGPNSAFYRRLAPQVRDVIRAAETSREHPVGCSAYR